MSGLWMGENAKVQLSSTNASYGIGVMSCWSIELAFGAIGDGSDGFSVFLLTYGSALELFY